MSQTGRRPLTQLLTAVVNVLSSRKMIRVLSNPALLVQAVLRRLPNVPVETKVALDLYDRPTYAYGLWTAAKEAKALGLSRITVIEFGVGTGYGLLAMEEAADEICATTGVQIDVVGFDNGAGLPPPADYRDLPYLYGRGYYAMDEGALRKRLRSARLIVGDVTDTVPAFVDEPVAPIGFISFDLDYYSSTMAAFRVFDGDPNRFLPRVVCYFDDMSNADALQCSFTGEALAIQEFNNARNDAKLDRISALRGSRLIDSNWSDVMYACHFFDHKLYNQQVVAQAAEYIAPLSAADTG